MILISNLKSIVEIGGYIGSFILGLTSIITAFATIRALKIQNKIQKESLEIEKSKHQPIFIFDTNKIKELINDEIIYSESLQVRNVGNEIRLVEKISVSTIFEVHICGNNYQHSTIHYINLLFFYKASELPYNVSSKQSDIYTLQGNIDFYDELIYFPINSRIDLLFKNLNYSAKRYNLFKVEYEDIFNKKHVLYYKDNHLISNDQYNKIMHIACLHPLNIHHPTISLKEVFEEILKERLKMLCTE